MCSELYKGPFHGNIRITVIAIKIKIIVKHMDVHGAYLWGFPEIWGLNNNRKDHEVAVAHRGFDRCARQGGPSQQKTGQRLRA